MTQHAAACSSTVLSCTIMTCMLQPQAAHGLGRRAQTECIFFGTPLLLLENLHGHAHGLACPLALRQKPSDLR